MSGAYGGQRYGFATQSAAGEYFKPQTTSSGLITSYRLQPTARQKLVGNAFADTLEVYEGADPNHDNDRLLRFNIRNASTDDLELLGFRVTLDKQYYKTISGFVADAYAEYQAAVAAHTAFKARYEADPVGTSIELYTANINDFTVEVQQKILEIRQNGGDPAQIAKINTYAQNMIAAQ